MRVRKLLIAGLLTLSVLTLFSAGCVDGQPELSLEEQAQDIFGNLMCPICAGQTIDQSTSGVATQMRDLVREQLADGETKEEILEFFTERYGEAVLAAPIKSGFNLIVWLAPITGIIIGGFGIWFVAKRWTRRKGDIDAESSSAETESEVDAKYREQIEKDLQDFEEKGFR